jgi:prepilin-type N-terminal cleavage/methylation domain-containing protein
MDRRQKGFTLIEILVVITIIATLAGLVAAIAPKMIEEGKKTESLNNLSQIGKFLLAEHAKGKMHRYSGAAFLLQIKDELKDNQLKVFISPGEEYVGDLPRPNPGTPEFAEMYRNLELPDGVDDRHSSYAGPNWKAYPPIKSGDESRKTRLWGCDKCPNGYPFHDGIVVLFDDGSTKFLDIEELQGHDAAVGTIQIGENSPDERLKKMTYLPSN